MKTWRTSAYNFDFIFVESYGHKHPTNMHIRRTYILACLGSKYTSLGKIDVYISIHFTCTFIRIGIELYENVDI